MISRFYQFSKCDDANSSSGSPRDGFRLAAPPTPVITLTCAGVVMFTSGFAQTGMVERVRRGEFPAKAEPLGHFEALGQRRVGNVRAGSDNHAFCRSSESAGLPGALTATAE